MPKRKSVKKFNKKHNTLKRFKGGNTVKTTCNKYKDKIVRGTPKNWAYKKCIKSGGKCNTLPPAGYGMYRYFCE